MGISTGVGIYLLLGLIALGIFDRTTKRIRNKLATAATETQSRLIASGTFVGNRMATILFIGAMWLFWPAVFIGVLTDKKKVTDIVGKKEEGLYGAKR